MSDSKLCLSAVARKMGTMLWQIERQREDLIKGLKRTPASLANEIQSGKGEVQGCLLL